MVAKGVQRAATTTDGNIRRERQAETAKQQQAEQVRLDARVKACRRSGQRDRAAPDMGPLWDLRRAFSVSFNLGIKLVSRKWRSTREAASCCQPVRHPTGSSSGGVGGRAPAARAGQDGGSNPITPVKFRRQSLASTKETGPTPVTEASTKDSAIARCLILTMGRVSAQLPAARPHPGSLLHVITHDLLGHPNPCP